MSPPAFSLLILLRILTKISPNLRMNSWLLRILTTWFLLALDTLHSAKEDVRVYSVSFLTGAVFQDGTAPPDLCEHTQNGCKPFAAATNRQEAFLYYCLASPKTTTTSFSKQQLPQKERIGNIPV